MKSKVVSAQEQQEAAFLARRLLKIQGPSQFVYQCIAYAGKGWVTENMLACLRAGIEKPGKGPKRPVSFNARIRRAQASYLTRQHKMEAAA